MMNSLRFAVLLGTIMGALLSSAQAADAPTAQVARVHGYERAILLTQDDARAVLSPQVGGRVLEFSIDGHDAMFLDDEDRAWRPGLSPPASAGRFDYGPELTTIPHPRLWSGEWTGEITGPCSARLTSPRDETAGIQLVRDFELTRTDNGSNRLTCKQTILNIASEVRDVCHWGRSFSPGGGICLIPLGDHPSRFPAKYAMYEDSAVINVRNTDDQIRERDGFLEILSAPRKPKLGFDTMAGWFAYLMPNNTLFVKRYATFPDRVYNEAAGLTLSVWYPPGPRIELEPIGPRERLQPGESASFAENWWLLTYPYPDRGQHVDLRKLSAFVAEHARLP